MAKIISKIVKKPQYILSIFGPEASIASTGGKGASLTRMARADLPIPEGFHITTDAHKNFIALNNLRAQIFSELKTTNLSNLGSLKKYLKKISNLTLPNSIKGGTSKKIRKLFPNLDEVYWEATFWADGFFVKSVGNITDKVISEYVKHYQKY